jgi:segregation and condensation protein A
MDFSAPTLEVQMSCYEGPLSALVTLIRRNKVDIWEVPLAFIADRFLQYVELARGLELRIAEDFIDVVSLLIVLKAKMLLPRDGGSPEEDDAREAIAERIIEYEKVKTMARSLDGMPVLQRDIFCSGGQRADGDGNMSLMALCQVFFDLIKSGREQYLTVPEIRPTLEEKLSALQDILNNSRTFQWDYRQEEAPAEKVATVLAMLELTKARFATVAQRRPFGSIVLKRRDG